MFVCDWPACKLAFTLCGSVTRSVTGEMRGPKLQTSTSNHTGVTGTLVKSERGQLGSASGACVDGECGRRASWTVSLMTYCKPLHLKQYQHGQCH